MTDPTISLLQRQLETTLQLIILVSSNMTEEEILIARVCLAEASIILGQILVRQNEGNIDGKI